MNEMTFKVIHRLQGFVKCNFSTICAAFYMISNDEVLAQSLCVSWASCFSNPLNREPSLKSTNWLSTFTKFYDSGDCLYLSGPLPRGEDSQIDSLFIFKSFISHSATHSRYSHILRARFSGSTVHS